MNFNDALAAKFLTTGPKLFCTQSLWMMLPPNHALNYSTLSVFQVQLLFFVLLLKYDEISSLQVYKRSLLFSQTWSEDFRSDLKNII